MAGALQPRGGNLTHSRRSTVPSDIPPTMVLNEASLHARVECDRALHRAGDPRSHPRLQVFSRVCRQKKQYSSKINSEPQHYFSLSSCFHQFCSSRAQASEGSRDYPHRPL